MRNKIDVSATSDECFLSCIPNQQSGNAVPQQRSEKLPLSSNVQSSSISFDGEKFIDNLSSLPMYNGKINKTNSLNSMVSQTNSSNTIDQNTVNSKKMATSSGNVCNSPSDPLDRQVNAAVSSEDKEIARFLEDVGSLDENSLSKDDSTKKSIEKTIKTSKGKKGAKKEIGTATAKECSIVHGPHLPENVNVMDFTNPFQDTSNSIAENGFEESFPCSDNDTPIAPDDSTTTTSSKSIQTESSLLESQIFTSFSYDLEEAKVREEASNLFIEFYDTILFYVIEYLDTILALLIIILVNGALTPSGAIG